MTEKRTVTLEIAGARYRMTSDADEQHLLRLAAVVNERMEGLGIRAARTASPAQMLAVVALGLADDLLTSEQRLGALEETTRKALQHAINRIDRRLEADQSLAGSEDG
jgi:cell division protein ZapA (FtsZ GTPase activity inhibitor)